MSKFDDQFVVTVLSVDGQWRDISFGNEGAMLAGVRELLNDRANVKIKIQRLVEEDDEE